MADCLTCSPAMQHQSLSVLSGRAGLNRPSLSGFLKSLEAEDSFEGMPSKHEINHRVMTLGDLWGDDETSAVTALSTVYCTSVMDYSRPSFPSVRYEGAAVYSVDDLSLTIEY